MFVYRDEEFGEIYIRSDSRACRLIFRVKDNGLQITCPEGYAVNRVKSAVDDNREKLRVLVSRSVTIRKIEFCLRAIVFLVMEEIYVYCRVCRISFYFGMRVIVYRCFVLRESI